MLSFTPKFCERISIEVLLVLVKNVVNSRSIRARESAERVQQDQQESCSAQAGQYFHLSLEFSLEVSFFFFVLHQIFEF